MGRFTDVMRQEDAIEDSLKLAEAKHDSTIQALQEIQVAKEKRDSLNVELATVDKGLSEMETSEKVGEVPLVKLAKLLGKESIHTVEALNQGIYDLGVSAINSAGIPINKILENLIGYNPGISGERSMDYLMGVGEGSLYEGWSGLGEDARYPGAGRFFGKDDPDEASMLGGLISTYAPEGGEWVWETEAKEKKLEIEKELEKE